MMQSLSPRNRTKLLEWINAAGSCGLPTAMLHYVRRPPIRSRHRGLFLTPPAFRAFLRVLTEAGVQSAPLSALSLSAGVHPRVALTFDDGSDDLIRNALPALNDTGFRATAFIVAGRIGGINDWDAVSGDAAVQLADECQIREWLDAGQSIGAHTVTHRSLTKIGLSEARREIQESKSRLEDKFGVAVTDFCYPFGDVNEAIRDLVVEAGFRTACSVCPGNNFSSDDPFMLKRVAIQHGRAWLAAVFPQRFSQWY